MGNSAGGEAPSIVHQAISAPGRPLDAGTRRFFEARYGHNFGDVQVHTDAGAADSARALNSLAYTVGRHIVFGPGQYAPHAQGGQRLLAHELAHTVQQRGATGSVQRLAIGRHDSAMEREADHAAQSALRGHDVRIQLRASSEQVQGFSVTEEPAGGCGICYDVEFPGKGPQNAGRVAHTVVQAAFVAALSGVGKYRFVELPFSAPGDENGRLDLAVATPTGFAIGEIKPATPNGEKQGLKDLEWYTTNIAAVHPLATVEPLVTAIPVGGGLPMPDALATVANCSQQLLGVIMMRPGLYGYFCEPPFSKARPTCPCNKLVPPLPVPVDAKEKKKVDEKEKKKSMTGSRTGRR